MNLEPKMKKPYSKPVVIVHGTVATLTKSRAFKRKCHHRKGRTGPQYGDGS